ncbi:MAG: PDZ domain-containing protein [Acidobacteria bacterium]|nr:PDZ domain-containing protein [Acidobacteriota bacterium]
MTNRIRILLISVSCFLVSYVVMGGLLGKNDSSSEKTYRNLGVYSEVLSRIKRDYVTEPDLRRVTDGSIRGLLEALDPYSTYLSPQEYQQYVEHPSPGPADVGIFLSKRMGFATVVSVLPGSPAEKGGIKAGDLIDRVENAGTRELSVMQLQRMLGGAPGTEVSVTVVREVRGDPQKIALMRAALNYPPAVSKIVEEGAGYIRIATFDKGKAAEVAAKLKALTASGANKIVLDLRNCAGGDVDEAVSTASLFLDEGLVGYVQGQRYPRQDIRTRPSASVCKLPLAVLINQSTAGPAELVASAILNNKRGEVVGVRSFGIGVLQKAIPVGDGSALLLSVAKYYGSDGQAIHDNGVTPSVTQSAVEEGPGLAEDDELAEPEHFGEADDPQLRKAIEVLTQKSAVAKAA